MKTIGVILAAGKGSRMGTTEPKQFLMLGEKSIVEYSLTTFNEHPLIDEIAVVVAQEYAAHMAEIISRGEYSKVQHILIGGDERYKSSLVAVEKYRDNNCNILLHDAARPLVAAETITACVNALRSYEAVCTVMPTTDTILELSDEGCVTRIPPRRMLYNAQTPQAFRATTIAKAFALATDNPTFIPSDDCSVVLRYLPKVSIKTVCGSEDNIKITYKSDLARIESLLTKR